jgi:pimeloyl-ACP methyl ester carboxylesterase
MREFRRYGNPPFCTVVLHGGPGAPGYMAPVARELAAERGVLEPLQAATSVDGQVEELRVTLIENAHLPVALVGSSWGAMLGFIFAAKQTELVSQLILIGSAVYEDRYASAIEETRLSRLSEDHRREAHSLIHSLAIPGVRDQRPASARLATLYTIADSYDPLTLDIEVLEHQLHVYQSVWAEAQELRRSGQLLELGKQIRCPVLAIHGDHDPHPAEGVRQPLSQVLGDFRFILLERCGHLPWIERHARDQFFALLREALGPG